MSSFILVVYTIITILNDRRKYQKSQSNFIDFSGENQYHIFIDNLSTQRKEINRYDKYSHFFSGRI